MAPIKRRKRKSAGLGDIFEVSDKDLSPEPEENDIADPGDTFLKTQDSDVPTTRRNNTQLNLNDNGPNSKENENIAEKRVDNFFLESEDLQIVDGSFQASNENSISKTVDGISTKEQSLSTTPCNDLIVEEISFKDSVKLLSGKNSDKTKNNFEEIVTVVDDLEDDVVIIDVCKEAEVSNPQVLGQDILEDGELNENTSEHMIIPNCSITIKFNDKLIADIYKPTFCRFIQAFPELKVQSVDDTVLGIIRDEDLDPKEWVVVDSVSPINRTEEELAKRTPESPKIDNSKKKRKKRKQQKGADLFIVDTSPSATSHKPILTKYSTKFLINDKHQEEDKITKPTFSSICFNCDKEHSLKDCPLPKNYAKINANRQKHQTKNKVARYHLDEEQKYGHLKPGKISANLIKALGLQEVQVPGYVYQMRRLGYPPGWLEEAKFVSSDLTLFDIDGNNVKNTNSKPRKGLDPDKVVEYPGFNVPFENNFEDEFKYYRVPPFCDRFSKQRMIEAFKEMSQHEDDFETQDMDLDNTNDLMDDIHESGLERKKLDYSVDSDSNNEPSISLQELQKQKDSLIEEIKKSGETIPWEQPSEDTENTNQSNISGCKIQEKNMRKNPSDIDNIENTSITTETHPCNKSSSPPRSCVKHTALGTPILKSSSPYNRLPNPDNFTKGVSPVIDFENLPNSTGKYEQMTDVLQKVRRTLKNLQH